MLVGNNFDEEITAIKMPYIDHISKNKYSILSHSKVAAIIKYTMIRKP